VACAVVLNLYCSKKCWSNWTTASCFSESVSQSLQSTASCIRQMLHVWEF